MSKKLYQTCSQVVEILKIAATTFTSWKLSSWLQFWITNKPTSTVMLRGIKISIRSGTLFTKLADISMAYECLIRDDYHINSLQPSNGSHIIDIGAHIGSFSVLAATQFPKTTILSFEPSSENAEISKKNIEINSLKNVKLFNKAVTDKKGTVTMHLHPMNSAANSLYAKKGRTVTVSSLSLADILTNNSVKMCSFVKMDCEGAEYQILLHTPISILKKIQSMIIEYHDPTYFGIDNKTYTVQNVITHLKNAGFSCTVKKAKNYQGFIIARRQ